MTGEVTLRDTIPSDLLIFFEQQSNAEARAMAAFTEEGPLERDAFVERQTKFASDPTIIRRTILCDGNVAGNIVSYLLSDEREIGYWLGRGYWGQGIATQALALFLQVLPQRPLYARAAKDNAASLRVLEKCGFTLSGEGKGFSNSRGEEVEEYILKLEATAPETSR